jgi:hypothetical protein
MPHKCVRFTDEASDDSQGEGGVDSADKSRLRMIHFCLDDAADRFNADEG